MSGKRIAQHRGESEGRSSRLSYSSCDGDERRIARQLGTCEELLSGAVVWREEQQKVWERGFKRCGGRGGSEHEPEGEVNWTPARVIEIF
jgi:hypothetical protein